MGRISPSTGPPVEELVAVSGIFDRGQLVIEPWLDDPMPDDDCGLVLQVQTAIEQAEAAMTHAI
ncbi:MAG: hypothetical protein FJ256_00395 [Phycisphaerae bacterium]|nr:hypothetical protein [Phycisphaerae bacterium]